MPSPEVINLTLSDDEIQPDPIRSDQGTSTPTRATNRFRTSSSTPPTSGINRTRRILQVIQGTFAAIEQAENYLPLQPFFNNTHFGQTLINCIHNQHRIGIPDEIFVETCINTYTQNSFVTREFVKIDEDSQTQDYTIIYIRFQGWTPPFSTHNQDIFERLLPTPFPQVGDILSEEEDSGSEQELIAQHYLEQGSNPNSKPWPLSSLQPKSTEPHEEPSEQDPFNHLLYKVLRLTSRQVQDLNGWMEH